MHWATEASNPADMVNLGWSKESFKPGDEVTVTFAPVKNGAPVGRIEQVVLASGQILKARVVFKSIDSTPRVESVLRSKLRKEQNVKVQFDFRSLRWFRPLMVASPVRAQTTPPQQPGAAKKQKAGPRSTSRHFRDLGPGQRRNPAAWPAGHAGRRQAGTSGTLHSFGAGDVEPHKPSNGIRSVLPGETNDPVVYCDPQGIPREDLYELRTTQILQTPLKVVRPVRIWQDLARNLDGRARAAQRSRAKVVWLLDGQVGG